MARFAGPFGLAQMRDGSIIVGDEQNGILYRVTYSGGTQQASVRP